MKARKDDEMKLNRKKLMLWLGAMLSGVVLWGETLVICGSCGTEATEGARFCSHCGAALDAGENASASAPQTVPQGGGRNAASAKDVAVNVAEIGSEAALSCVRSGRQQMQAGRPDVAKILYADALYIAGVDPAILSTAQGDKLQAEIRACDEALAMIRVECPVCQGTGRRSMTVTSLGGSANDSQTTALSTGVRCATCGGTGKRLRRRTVGERKTALGQGTQAAETAFRSLGFVQEGNAWIPQEWVSALTLVQRCRLRRAAAQPCPDCLGFGMSDCKKCGASGFVPCKAKGCDNGWVVDEPLNSLDSSSVKIRSRKPCPTCKGTAQVVCLSCAGRGSQTCSRCEGQGRRSMCNTCGGEGMGVCTACRGTGETRATAKAAAQTCPACEGSGKGFCKSCHGEGYGK